MLLQDELSRAAHSAATLREKAEAASALSEKRAQKIRHLEEEKETLLQVRDRCADLLVLLCLLLPRAALLPAC